MAYTQQKTDQFGSWTEVVEDPELATVLAGTEEDVAYQVLDDSWDAEFITRTIRKARLISVG